MSIRTCPLPDDALLRRYQRYAYADCYTAALAGTVVHREFVTAFYTTWLFKLERLILKCLVSKPSTDAQAEQLADGTLNTFAAWRVEDRGENQLLMCDFMGRTRSWLMTTSEGGTGGTRLYFGSAVVPIRDPNTGRSSLGFGFTALLGFHKLYSRALLRAASRKLRKSNSPSPTREFRT